MFDGDLQGNHNYRFGLAPESGHGFVRSSTPHIPSICYGTMLVVEDPFGQEIKQNCQD